MCDGLCRASPRHDCVVDIAEACRGYFSTDGALPTTSYRLGRCSFGQMCTHPSVVPHLLYFLCVKFCRFFFFFLIEVCRQYRNTKPGLVSQCVGASTRPVRQTWQLSFIFHPELISYSSHAGHSGNGSFPPQPLLHDSYFLNFSCNVFYKPQPPSGMY